MAESRVAVFRDRSTVMLFAAVFASTMASLCQATALGKQVYDLTGRELDLGLLGLAEFAPAALLVTVTGHVADKYDRRRVVAAGLMGELVCGILLAVYAASNPTSVKPIFGLVIAFGVAHAFVAPAIRSLPADVSTPTTFPQVVAINATMWQGAIITGPVLAGFLYAVDPSWAFVATAVLIGIAIVAVSGVVPATRRVHIPSTETGLRQAFEGLRVIRSNPILLGAISLDLFAVLFGGAVALLPTIAEKQLHVGAIGLGWLRAAAGIGAALTSVALAARPLTRRVGPTLFTVVAIFGAFTIVLGVTHSYALAFVALAGAERGRRGECVHPGHTRAARHSAVSAGTRCSPSRTSSSAARTSWARFESGVAGQLLGISGAVVLRWRGHPCDRRALGPDVPRVTACRPLRRDRATRPELRSLRPILLDPRPHDGREVIEVLAWPFTDQGARDGDGGAVTVDHDRPGAHAPTELAPVGLRREHDVRTVGIRPVRREQRHPFRPQLRVVEVGVEVVAHLDHPRRADAVPPATTRGARRAPLHPRDC